MRGFCTAPVCFGHTCLDICPQPARSRAVSLRAPPSPLGRAQPPIQAPALRPTAPAPRGSWLHRARPLSRQGVEQARPQSVGSGVLPPPGPSPGTAAVQEMGRGQGCGLTALLPCPRLGRLPSSKFKASRCTTSGDGRLPTRWLPSHALGAAGQARKQSQAKCTWPVRRGPGRGSVSPVPVPAGAPDRLDDS